MLTLKKANNSEQSNLNKFSNINYKLNKKKIIIKHVLTIYIYVYRTKGHV